MVSKDRGRAAVNDTMMCCMCDADLMMYLPSMLRVTVVVTTPGARSPSCSSSSPRSDQSCTPSPGQYWALIGCHREILPSDWLLTGSHLRPLRIPCWRPGGRRHSCKYCQAQGPGPHQPHYQYLISEAGHLRISLLS